MLCISCISCRLCGLYGLAMTLRLCKEVGNRVDQGGVESVLYLSLSLCCVYLFAGCVACMACQGPLASVKSLASGGMERGQILCCLCICLCLCLCLCLLCVVYIFLQAVWLVWPAKDPWPV